MVAISIVPGNSGKYLFKIQKTKASNHQNPSPLKSVAKYLLH
jgi:hypothetical protein